RLAPDAHPPVAHGCPNRGHRHHRGARPHGAHHRGGGHHHRAELVGGHAQHHRVGGRNPKREHGVVNLGHGGHTINAVDASPAATVASPAPAANSGPSVGRGPPLPRAEPAGGEAYGPATPD